MGQKVNPIGFRLGTIRNWESIWYASDKNFGQQLRDDIRLRRFVKARLKHAGVSRIIIERPADKIKVTVHTSRPGVVIGKKGSEIDAVRAELVKEFGKEVQVFIVEVRRPEAEAQLVAENIAFQLERRVAFRRAMKRAVQSALRMGAKGVRINCSGRLGGAEIARTEWYREGRVPLHTLRADVDYGFAEAHTTYGVIGVKVWVFNGLKLGDSNDAIA
ncbi:30S ribosomal protein S3 [Mariprofundus erugo]|uniref:Small ribosomal subunit protein uS3 n=1 Tax=Mariprofundus erugo TaxID=2528639 RepID=A0A5R9GM66_9PROT|nr:30S ribosomal protein S3 [Mariprofundus erugo]TLS65523.1 30S ribosomal protein S3 [Mariprofundus erugo]TLS74071.1 30S ribosomal protein S3 [Mariprofundus erugo]